MSEIGNKLFSLRNANGRKISAQRIADKLGKTVQAVYGYEKGLVIPDLATLMKISEFYNVPLKELTGETYEGVKVDDVLQNKEDNNSQPKTNTTDLSLVDELKKERDFLREKLDEANRTINQLVNIMANGVGKLEGDLIPSYYVHNLAQSALIVG